ncbi:MAG: DNA gyrase subunit A [Candidatus Obscuribacterales bacterium]|nr:DNA gyrase subunit A [Candidatus Obscuribacterales bacterium]
MSGGERIIEIEVGQEMRRSFIDYAMSVIVSRAIPDVRDGLKPVHRRIIYGMYELGLEPSKPFRKAAKTVGDVMGKYHPHGDSAIYEALVRLAQPQASRYPLINGHGNFGDLDNPPAAMRYTEAKLTPLAMEMLALIEHNTVETRPNFDESEEEPAVLPAKAPLLLLNGSSGIAVGMATNMPPHNLREVCDGVIAKIDNPDLDSVGLMQYIKGPDFPGGGSIVGTDGIREAYTTGRGSIMCRGDATIEQLPGGGGRQSRMAIIVTSLPYLVGPEAFAKKVADLVKEEKIAGISDVNDETDRTGLRVVIELRRDAHPEVVLNNLYKYSQLQQSFPVNMLGLRLAQSEPRQTLGTADTRNKKKPEARKCRPLTMQLHQLIQDFIDHRVEVVENSFKFKLEKALAEAHIQEGKLKALDNLDEVIKIIRGAESAEAASQALMAKFELTEVQAEAILAMTLRALTRMSRETLEEEHKKLLAEIAQYKKILASRQEILDIIKKDLAYLKEKFGDDRRTQITYASTDDISAKDLIPNEKMLIFITKQSYIKRTPLDTFKRQRRNTRGVSGLKTKDEDDLQHCLEANTHDKLLVFSSKGLVYSIDVMDIPESSRTSSGRAILNLVNMSQDDTVTAVIPVSEEDLKRGSDSTVDLDDEAPEATEGSEEEELVGGVVGDEDYFVMLTTHGFIKKVPISQFAKIRKKGIAAIKLDTSGADKDQLGWVRRSTGKSFIIIGSADGMCIRYHESDVRPMGRSARGVRAMSLRDGDRIVGFDAIELPAEPEIEEDDSTEVTDAIAEAPPASGSDNFMLFVTTDGYGKRTPVTAFRRQRRGGLGIIGIRFKKPESKLACLRIVNPKQEVLIATMGGIVVRQRVDDISVQGRMATGVRLQQVGDDQVMAVTPVAEPPSTGDSDGDAAPPATPPETKE